MAGRGRLTMRASPPTSWSAGLWPGWCRRRPSTSTEKGLVEEGAPILVRLIAQLSSRFAASVSEKVAAQSVPLIGAAGGAAINLLFIDHFQDMARGHFVVRRLERAYGAELVRAEYERI